MMPVAPPRSPAIGLLLSGGLDSAILAGVLLAEGREVQPFYVHCGLYWESAERRAAEKFLQAIQRPGLRPLVDFDLPLADVYGAHWSVSGVDTPADDTPDEAVFLPGRNALLLIKAAVWCQLHGLTELALAPLAGNPFGDATDEFFDSFEKLTGHLGGPPIQIRRPFRRLHKPAVMRLGRDLPLELTFSCIQPRHGLHCGVCNKCHERKLAFADAELVDRTEYDAGGGESAE